ncbi:hypothetical protein [Pseudomonas sp. F3-2]|uniref:hypothetical protein n=1 Tax=Pseudomonas sp. F3-2 TaxID=3141539 RepID=UPI00315C866C
MGVVNIIFVCASSILYYWIVSYFKELSLTKEWAYNVAVPCLVATTFLINYIKDKISERDPSSKLCKATNELASLKASYDSDIKKIEKNNEESRKAFEKRHEKEIKALTADITHLTGKLSVKDTIIHGIRNGITTGLIKHGETPALLQYVKDLATNINSDLDVNTLAPVFNDETKKYIEMFKKIEQ